MIHLNWFTLLMAAIILCAVASILSRLLPKRGTRAEAPKYTNTPPDYELYLKHKQLSKLYEEEEPLSFQKFFSGFGKGKNWAKSLALGIMMCIIVGVGYSVVTKVIDVFGKKPAPIVSTITNSGDGKVESKTESKTETKTSNGLNLNLLSGWF